MLESAGDGAQELGEYLDGLANVAQIETDELKNQPTKKLN